MRKSYRALFDVRRDEWAPTLLMSTYFFLVITSFWILKPIKKSIFLGFYKNHASIELLGRSVSPAELELVPKLLNTLVAIVAASAFASLSARVRRERLTYVFGGFMLVCFGALSTLIDSPSEGTVWAFYLFGDLFNMLMVATFFAFQNDIVSPELARRTYSVVGLGGVAGGVFGTTFVKARIADFSTSSWLWLCFAATFAVMVIAGVVSRRARALSGAPSEDTQPIVADARAGIAGAHVVARSPYLLCIVGIVAIYEIVSTVLDFQFSATISYYLDGPAIGEQLATVFMITNVASLFVQLLGTGWVMRRLGVRAALSVLPLAVLVVSSSFAALPLLWVGSSLSITDNALNYSMNQSAKESLYVPTSAVEKYQAKAFIDMFVQRSAKALGVLLTIAMNTLIADDFSAVRYLSLMVVVLALVWLLVARHAGERFDAMAGAPAE